MTPSSATAAADREFGELLRDRRLSVVFQPIVQLSSGETIGHEALVRGPRDSALRSADSLVAAAYRTHRVAEFDWLARAEACRAALRAGLGHDRLLFLNIEPLALDSECPADLWPDIKAGFERLSVVLEVTERSLMRDPATLLNGIERYRPLIAGLALDDVGSDAVTLSMLSLIGPAVIKLDRRVLLDGPTSAAVRILDVVHDEAERTGALILAEGIEAEQQSRLARSLGVFLGQGHLFGRPGPIARDTARHPNLPVRQPPTVPATAPFDVLDGRVTGQAAVPVLAALIEQLANRIADDGTPSVFVMVLPGPDLLSADGRDRLTGLARRGVLTAAVGVGLPEDLGRGVRVRSLAPDDQLANEWGLIAFGPHWATAIVARSVPSADADDAEYEYGLTYNRGVVIPAARCVIRRLDPTGDH